VIRVAGIRLDPACVEEQARADDAQPDLQVGHLVAYFSRPLQSPIVSNEALPPAAVVLTVSVRSVTKRNR